MLILTFFIGQVPCIILAQEVGTSTSGDQILFQDSMDDLSMITGFGVGGAVLGLSTLSFSEHPEKSLNNILVGASLGIIVGVGVVAWNQATKTHDTIMTSERLIEKGENQYVSTGFDRRQQKIREGGRSEGGFDVPFLLFNHSF